MKKTVLFCLLQGTALLAFANQNTVSNTQPPKGVCVFDIDGTLTQAGSITAVQECVKLGFGIGINTGEDQSTAQVSMNAIYNGISARGQDLVRLYNQGYYSIIETFYNSYHPIDPNTLIGIIGDGTNTPSSPDSKTPASPGNVDKDVLFQYSGGCKVNSPYTCTNYPYKHEGLENIASFYYSNYVRSNPGDYPPAVSDVRNECVVLFDDQKNTIEKYANNLDPMTLGSTSGEHSKQFRAVYVEVGEDGQAAPGAWPLNTPEHAKTTVDNTINNLPAHCRGNT
jgi:hypothetical protein